MPNLTAPYFFTPRITPERRCFVEALPHDFYRVILTFGFAENPNVPEGLATCRTDCGLQLNPLEASYFIGGETLIPSPKSDLSKLQEQIYIFMANTSANAADFFAFQQIRPWSWGGNWRCRAYVRTDSALTIPSPPKACSAS